MGFRWFWGKVVFLMFGVRLGLVLGLGWHGEVRVWCSGLPGLHVLLTWFDTGCCFIQSSYRKVPRRVCVSKFGRITDGSPVMDFGV